MNPATPDITGFRIEGLIGRGGMGTVYKATQISLERTVALKVVLPHLAEDAEFRDRFRSEMRLAAKLDHPNFVTVYEAGESNGHLFIAMQHIEGENLADRISRRGALQLDEAVSVLGQVSLALDDLHREGIVHRDVKPANILLDEGRGRALLSDFGIAKSLEATRGLTATGFGIGSIRFISPEQARNRPVDGRSDVYSLGCAFFEAIAGGSPYGDDESDASILLAKVNDEVRLPSEVRPELGTGFDEVVRRAMALEPDDRFPTAEDFATAARQAASGETITKPVAIPASAEEPTPRWPPGRWMRLVSSRARGEIGGLCGSRQPSSCLPWWWAGWRRSRRWEDSALHARTASRPPPSLWRRRALPRAMSIRRRDLPLMTLSLLRPR